MENITPDNPVDALPPTQKAPATEPRKKKMSEAALAANRANAQKSTGPRTAAGKARSASNAFQHGLYSMKNYRHLVMHPNLVAATIHNLLEEYQPVTPTEHMLLQQLIHFELRFLQSEHICNHYMLNDKHDAPDRAYLTVLRELDRIPNRILKTIKALKALIAERGTNKEIEPCTFLVGRLNSSQSVTCQGVPIEPSAFSALDGHVPLARDTQRELQ